MDNFDQNRYNCSQFYNQHFPLVPIIIESKSLEQGGSFIPYQCLSEITISLTKSLSNMMYLISTSSTKRILQLPNGPKYLMMQHQKTGAVSGATEMQFVENFPLAPLIICRPLHKAAKFHTTTRDVWSKVSLQFTLSSRFAIQTCSLGTYLHAEFIKIILNSLEHQLRVKDFCKFTKRNSFVFHFYTTFNYQIYRR